MNNSLLTESQAEVIGNAIDFAAENNNHTPISQRVEILKSKLMGLTPLTENDNDSHIVNLFKPTPQHYEQVKLNVGCNSVSYRKEIIKQMNAAYQTGDQPSPFESLIPLASILTPNLDKLVQSRSERFDRGI